MGYPERLELRGAALERWDAAIHRPALDAMRSDADVTSFLPFLLTEDLAHLADRQARHWEAHGFGLWAVVVPGHGPLGWVGAVHPRWHPGFVHRVELAWALCRPARGLGIATRGGRAAASACFDTLGLPDVMAFFDPANARSIAVGERLGMEPAGETAEPVSGRRLLTYELTPDRLRAPTPPFRT